MSGWSAIGICERLFMPVTTDWPVMSNVGWYKPMSGESEQLRSTVIMSLILFLSNRQTGSTHHIYSYCEINRPRRLEATEIESKLPGVQTNRVFS